MKTAKKYSLEARARAARRVVAMLLGGFTLAGYVTLADDDTTQHFPDVVDVRVQTRGTNVFDFSVTVSSPYDTPQRYADAFHVSGSDGSVYGERTLFHDHADEQPFTRDLREVRIPPTSAYVIVQARDKRFGYGGKSIKVVLPGR